MTIRLSFLLVLLGGTVCGQGGPPDCATIWNGFSQVWGYNHRVRTLRDRIVHDAAGTNPCMAQWDHAAASGTGADSLEFVQYGVEVRAPGVSFYPWSERLEFEGREGERMERTVEGFLQDASLTSADAPAELLLNGFDLSTFPGASPDKLIEFGVGVDSLWVEPEGNLLHYRIKAVLRVACSSGECPRLDQAVNYSLNVECLLVLGDFRSTRGEVGNGTTWTRDSLASVELQEGRVLGAALEEPQTGGYIVPECLPDSGVVEVMGIRGVHVLLDGEHHMLGWDSQVGRPRNLGNGLYAFGYGLHFQQWGPDMYAAYKGNYHRFPKPPAKSVVKREAGSAVMEMDVSLLQFSEGVAQWQTRRGRMFWHPKKGWSEVEEEPFIYFEF